MKKLIAALALAMLLTSCVNGSKPVDTSVYSTDTAGVSTDNKEDTNASGVQTETPAEYIEKPTVTMWKNIAPDTVMVVGTCEDGQAVYVKGSNTDKTVIADGCDYLFTVKIPEGTDRLSITAVKDGAQSEAVTVDVSYNGDAEELRIFATDSSRLFQNAIREDVCRTNSYSEAELRYLKSKLNAQAEKIRRTTGKDTEVIYLLAPYSLTVYPEGIGELSEAIIDRPSRYEQIVQTLSQTDGVTVIDTSDVLKQNRDKGKLYYNLDTHWTELGAYFAYTELMKTVSQRFSEAKAHTLDEYDIENVTLTYTDMIYYAGVDEGMRETAPFLHSKYEPLTHYDKAKKEEANIAEFSQFFRGKRSVTAVDGDGLPTAQVLFDSYGFNLIPFAAEHFSTFACQPVWKYSVDYSMTEEYKPDYVIYILNERTVDTLFE